MTRIFDRVPAAVLVVMLAGPVIAQEPEAPKFSDQRLEEIAAPIALYPDSLLMQIFMAATYPLEVIEADRWLRKQSLSGEALDNALKAQDWDASVKSLCTLPDVLSNMSKNLDWTRDMGDAFLEKQSELLDAVQRLRGKADEAGNLKTTKEQTVTVEQDKIIVIKSADPEIIYVPSYSPTVVYGTWPYTTVYYAPLYQPPPPGYSALAFTAGVVVGAALWGNCNWGWGHSNVNVNVNHYNNFNRQTNNNFRNVSNNNWQHNPEHRKGVNYRDGATAQRYGAGEGRDRVSRNEARGYDRSQGRSGTSRGNRARTSTGQGSRDNRSGAGRGNSYRSGQSNRTRTASSHQGRRGAYQGSRNPHADRAASQRGYSSRSHSSRSSGRSRSGGGRSRGGGRRR